MPLCVPVTSFRKLVAVPVNVRTRRASTNVGWLHELSSNAPPHRTPRASPPAHFLHPQTTLSTSRYHRSTKLLVSDISRHTLSGNTSKCVLSLGNARNNGKLCASRGGSRPSSTRDSARRVSDAYYVNLALRRWTVLLSYNAVYGASYCYTLGRSDKWFVMSCHKTMHA